MKIVQLIQTLGLGGLEILVERISLALRDAGHDVHVVALTDGGLIADRMTDAGIPFTLCDPPVRGLFHIKRLRDILLKVQPDVVHMHGLPAGTLGRTALVGTSIRTVYHLHTSVREAHHPTASMRFREQMLSLRPGKIVTVSESVRQDYSQTFHIPPSRINVLSGGVPDMAPQERAACRKRLELPEDAFAIAMVGSLTPVKRHVDAIRAMLELPEAILLLAGAGPLKSELETLVAELGLENRIRFLGKRDDIHTLYSAADLALMVSSPREGLGLALIEAQRAGLAAVATQIGGIPEVVKHGVNGLLVAPENPQAIEDSIRQLIDNPSQLAELNRAAGESFKTRFAMPVYLNKLLKLYENKPLVSLKS